MSIEKIYDYLPHTKEGRVLLGLGLVLVGLLFDVGGLLTIILVPLGIIILAYDYEWARRLLRLFRDGLVSLREWVEGSSKSGDRKRR